MNREDKMCNFPVDLISFPGKNKLEVDKSVWGDAKWLEF